MGNKKNNISRIIWRDIDRFKIVNYVIILGFFTFFAYGLIVEHQDFIVWPSILIMGVLTFLLYGFIANLRIKLTYITTDGIRVGNAPDDVYTKMRLKNKPLFLKWTQIKSIRIYEEPVRHNFLIVKRPFLEIINLDNKRFKCFLSNPSEFIQTLRKLNKDRLIKSDFGKQKWLEESKGITKTSWTWALFSGLWLLIFIVVMIYLRFRNNSLDISTYLGLLLAAIVPPLIYLFFIRRKQTNGA